MNFDYLVIWYKIQDNTENILAGFPSLKKAKEYADNLDTLFFPRGIMVIDAPDGRYIRGIKDEKSLEEVWFEPPVSPDLYVLDFHEEMEEAEVYDDDDEFVGYKEHKEEYEYSRIGDVMVYDFRRKDYLKLDGR